MLIITGGCETEITKPVSEKSDRIALPFYEIYESTFLPECAEDNFFVINNSEDLDSAANKFINNSELIFSNIMSNVNLVDSTVIGFTSKIAYSGSAILSTDSLIIYQDTVYAYYTFDLRSSVYADVVSHTSIVRIQKTELSVKQIITLL